MIEGNVDPTETGANGLLNTTATRSNFFATMKDAYTPKGVTIHTPNALVEDLPKDVRRANCLMEILCLFLSLTVVGLIISVPVLYRQSKEEKDAFEDINCSERTVPIGHPPVAGRPNSQTGMFVTDATQSGCLGVGFRADRDEMPLYFPPNATISFAMRRFPPNGRMTDEWLQENDVRIIVHTNDGRDYPWSLRLGSIAADGTIIFKPDTKYPEEFGEAKAALMSQDDFDSQDIAHRFASSPRGTGTALTEKLKNDNFDLRLPPEAATATFATEDLTQRAEAHGKALSHDPAFLAQVQRAREACRGITTEIFANQAEGTPQADAVLAAMGEDPGNPTNPFLQALAAADPQMTFEYVPLAREGQEEVTVKFIQPSEGGLKERLQEVAGFYYAQFLEECNGNRDQAAQLTVARLQTIIGTPAPDLFARDRHVTSVTNGGNVLQRQVVIQVRQGQSDVVHKQMVLSQNPDTLRTAVLRHDIVLNQNGDPPITGASASLSHTGNGILKNPDGTPLVLTPSSPNSSTLQSPPFNKDAFANLGYAIQQESYASTGRVFTDELDISEAYQVKIVRSGDGRTKLVFTPKPQDPPPDPPLETYSVEVELRNGLFTLNEPPPPCVKGSCGRVNAGLALTPEQLQAQRERWTEEEQARLEGLAERYRHLTPAAGCGSGFCESSGTDEARRRLIELAEAPERTGLLAQMAAARDVNALKQAIAASPFAMRKMESAFTINIGEGDPVTIAADLSPEEKLDQLAAAIADADGNPMVVLQNFFASAYSPEILTGEPEARSLFDRMSESLACNPQTKAHATLLIREDGSIDVFAQSHTGLANLGADAQEKVFCDEAAHFTIAAGGETACPAAMNAWRCQFREMAEHSGPIPEEEGSENADALLEQVDE
jgi:hypothetical protein